MLAFRTEKTSFSPSAQASLAQNSRLSLAEPTLFTAFVHGGGDGPAKEAGWRWAPETVAVVAVASARLRSVCVYLNEELEREVPSYIGRRDTLTGAWRQRAAPRGAVAEWLRRVRAVFWEEA